MTEIFKFENHQVRFVGTASDPWWVAADICAVLEIANNRDALSRLDDDEKGVAITDTLGGRQQVTTINESGLYSLILTSRKPQAKKFKKWVTSEVLPAIRKTGNYSLKQKSTLSITEAIAFADIGAKSALSAGVDSDIVEQLKLESLMEMYPESKPLLKPQKDAIAANNPMFEMPMTPTDIGRELAMELGVESISAKAVNRKLLHLGYQQSITRTNSKGKEVHDYYQATEKGKAYSQLQMTAYVDGEGKSTKAQLRWFKSIVSILVRNWGEN